MSTKRSFKAFIPAVIWGLVIVYLSTEGGIDLPSTTLFEPDKIAHAGAYGLLTLLILYGYRSYNGQKVVTWIPQVLTAFFVAAGLGFLMELIQDRFFPGRMFEILDEIANISGTILSIGFFKLLLKL